MDELTRRRLIPAQEAAPLLGMTSVALRHWARKGAIAHVRIGNRVFFRADEILRVQEEGLKAPGADTGESQDAQNEVRNQLRLHLSGGVPKPVSADRDEPQSLNQPANKTGEGER